MNDEANREATPPFTEPDEDLGSGGNIRVYDRPESPKWRSGLLLVLFFMGLMMLGFVLYSGIFG